MDMSTMSANLRSLQTCVSTFALSKSMGTDAQSMAVMLQDMAAAVPTSPPSFGGMDIRA